jgi:hypothetical protein
MKSMHQLYRTVSRTAIVTFLLSAATIAHADDTIGQRFAAEGAFTPGVFRAYDSGNGFVTAAMTMDRARDRVLFDALGEAHVWGPFRALVRVLDVFDAAKPGIGVGAQVLDERSHGVAATAYLQFKTEGFTEPEGELELVLAFGKQLGGVRTGANLAYGQDPEGNERDAEAALSAQIEPHANVLVGAVARYRDGLGTMKEPIARDAYGLLTGTFVTGRFAIVGAAGVAMVELHGMPREVGPAATLSIGAGF